MEQRFKASRQLRFGEEVGNSVIHGVGALGMLILLPITAIYAYVQYDMTAVVGMSIFVISLMLMFLSSTVYHSMGYGSIQKYVLRVIDHSMIYIAIAGSYTPVALSLVGGYLGIIIMLIQWGVTIFGILYKILAKSVNEKFSLALYLVMGWIVVFLVPTIVQKTGPIFWGLMVLGGLFYTVGAVFYSRKRDFSHMIWHLFIVFAAVAQYIGIVFFMLPR